MPQPFAWEIVPDWANGAQGGSCRIFVPYTELNLDLDWGKADPGTIVHLYSRAPVVRQLWRFEIAGPIVTSRTEVPVTEPA
ncbi:hypothetical protein H1R20_g1270, partial [Candolleomyces eurysporus]